MLDRSSPIKKPSQRCALKQDGVEKHLMCLKGVFELKVIRVDAEHIEETNITCLSAVKE